MTVLQAVRWVDLPSVRDERGVLTSVESGRDVPFAIERVFYVHHAVVPRGGHAHRDTDQLIVAVSGSLRVELSDGAQWSGFELNDPTRGLYVPRMAFVRLTHFSPDAVCLVLASTHYDIRRSIRSWDEYLRAVEA